MRQTPTPAKIVKRALTGAAAIATVAAIFGAKAYEIEHRAVATEKVAMTTNTPQK